MPRSSTYTPDIAEAICARIEAGEPLAAICRDPNMPGVRTVLDWADSNEKFAKMYGRARDAQAEHLDAEIQRIAETAVDKSSAAAARVQITALTWRASKMAPRRYGEKLDVTSSGERVEALDPVARASRLASILRDIEKRRSDDAMDRDSVQPTE